MELTSDQYLLLKIISNAKGNGESIGAPKIDRMFYDARLNTGCNIDSLYDVQWMPISQELERLGLIDKQGLLNKITKKGKLVLAINSIRNV